MKHVNTIQSDPLTFSLGEVMMSCVWGFASWTANLCFVKFHNCLTDFFFKSLSSEKGMTTNRLKRERPREPFVSWPATKVSAEQPKVGPSQPQKKIAVVFSAPSWRGAHSEGNASAGSYFTRRLRLLVISKAGEKFASTGDIDPLAWFCHVLLARYSVCLRLWKSKYNVSLLAVGALQRLTVTWKLLVESSA